MSNAWQKQLADKQKQDKEDSSLLKQLLQRLTDLEKKESDGSAQSQRWCRLIYAECRCGCTAGKGGRAEKCA